MSAKTVRESDVMPCACGQPLTATWDDDANTITVQHGANPEHVRVFDRAGLSRANVLLEWDRYEIGRWTLIGGVALPWLDEIHAYEGAVMNDDRVARYQDLLNEYEALRLPQQSLGPRMERLEWIAYVARTIHHHRHDERALTGLWYTLEMALTSLDGDEQP